MWVSTGALLRSGTLRIPDLAKKSSTRLDSCCGLPETTPTPSWSQMRLASSEKTWRIKHFYHGGMAHGIKVVEQCVRGIKMNKVRFLQTCRLSWHETTKWALYLSLPWMPSEDLLVEKTFHSTFYGAVIEANYWMYSCTGRTGREELNTAGISS